MSPKNHGAVTVPIWQVRKRRQANLAPVPALWAADSRPHHRTGMALCALLPLCRREHSSSHMPHLICRPSHTFLIRSLIIFQNVETMIIPILQLRKPAVLGVEQLALGSGVLERTLACLMRELCPTS